MAEGKLFDKLPSAQLSLWGKIEYSVFGETPTVLPPYIYSETKEDPNRRGINAMSRLPIIQPQEFTPAQQRIFESITGGKRKSVSAAGSSTTAEGGLRGPFNALLYSPIIGDAVQRVGEAVRFEGALPPQLRELAILTVAAEWQAQYEWWAHERIARAEGLNDAIIVGVKSGMLPESADPEERMIYGVVRELIDQHHIADERYAAAVALFGEAAVVELVLLVGYYTLIAMTLNAFAVAVPPGEDAPWSPLEKSSDL